MVNKFVIAFSRAEFEEWYQLRSPEIFHGDIRLVYVSDVNILKGHRDISGYLVGQWYKRVDIAEIIASILVSRRDDQPNLFYNYVEKFPYRLDEKGRIIEYR